MACTLNASTASGGGIISTADATGTIELQSAGTTKLTVSSTGAYGALQLATAKPYNWNTLTTNKVIDFTDIPSWVKRITVMFNGVSTNGTSVVQIQLGTSGGFVTTGYLGTNGYMNNANVTFNGVFTTGIGIGANNSAADIRHGLAIITKITENTWVSNATVGTSNGSSTGIAAGAIALSGVLDRIRITTVTDIDVFDAGTINILYEG